MVEETTQQGGTLASEAERLRELVSQFRIGKPRGSQDSPHCVLPLKRPDAVDSMALNPTEVVLAI